MHADKLAFPMSYQTTNTYGKVIRTSPVSRIDKEFLNILCNELARLNEVTGAQFGHRTEDQLTFLTYLEDALLFVTGSEGTCNIFSDSKDHMKRPMRRYVVENKERGYHYLIDGSATLDVSLVLSKAKRFILTHLPRVWTNVDTSKFVPKIRYQIRVWNSPVGYYQIEFADAVIPVEYSSRIERMRQLIGYPDYYETKEIGFYERIDYDIRRALFHEGSDVLKK